MSDEINWEPQSVADLGVQLSRLGSEYRSSIADMYNEFNSIGANQYWVGHNFNVIANNTFNASKGNFDSWADYMQITVPQTICNIAEAQKSQNGSIYYSLEPVGTEIKRIEETVEKADGSQKLSAETVRNIVNGSLPNYCGTITEILNRYLAQFEELGTLNNNNAIRTMAEELQEILAKTRQLIETFSQESTDAVEKSIQGTELTDEETRQMASRIANIVA